MESENKSVRMRREASSFPWKELTEEQKNAVEDIAGLLNSALSTVSSAEHKRSGPIEMRFSRMSFIDGDRGMGKTSVLLTVQRLLQYGLEPAERDGPIRPHVRKLSDNRKSFVWLETLDMEPLSRTANLLAAILVRISAETGEIETSTPARMSLALDDLEARDKLASDFQQLELDAVLALEGAGGRGSGTSYSTAYAGDVLVSERAGLRITQRLGEVLEQIGRLLRNEGSEKSIFILPVDDFDLAPSRALELLRIIRMVSTPRLFFLIAGNVRIGEAVLRLQSIGDLGSLAKDPRDSDLVHDVALEIAANNLRKLIPPGQRVKLRAMSLIEALRFRAATEEPALEQMLAQIEFSRNYTPAGTPAISLKSFLVPEDAPQYVGNLWFTGTPRQVRDRAEMLEDLISDHSKDYGKHLLSKLIDIFSQEINEAVRGGIEEINKFFGDIETEPELRMDFRRYFAIEAVRGVTETIGSAWCTARCIFSPEVQWRLFVPSSEKEKVSAGPRVPQRVASYLTFLHDLAISLWGGYVVPNSIVYQSTNLSSSTYTDWSGETPLPPIPWRLPEWWTIREYQRFHEHWKSHQTATESIDDAMVAWLLAVLEVLMEVPASAASPVARLGTVKELLLKLLRETPKRFARGYIRDSAIVNIVLALCPETGCSARLAEDLLRTRQLDLLSFLLPRHRTAIRRRRSEVFEELTDGYQLSEPADFRLLAALTPNTAVSMALDLCFADVQLAVRAAAPQRRPSLSRLATRASLRKPEQAQKLYQALGSDSPESFHAAMAAFDQPYRDHPLNAPELGLSPEKVGEPEGHAGPVT
jgi:hypothetical protein